MIDPFGVGRTIERYRVERVLGHGGMATVVQVRHTVLGTPHAMKVMHLNTPRLIDRFLREGRLQASIHHPNLVPVTDVLTLPHGVALILEYVDGPTLADLIRLFRPSLAELDELAEQIMQGIGAAHARGVIHRDLKPANVLIARTPDGLLSRITDFGLARALVDGLGAAADLTQSGVPMGTPGYMAPEQYRSARDVDARADLFSLGAMLYELVTGCPPFDAPDLMRVYEQILAGRFVPVDQLWPEAPARMCAAIHAALSADPAARPADLWAFRELWHGGSYTPLPAWEAEHLDAVDRWLTRRATPTPAPPAPTPALPTVGTPGDALDETGLPPSLLPEPEPEPEVAWQGFGLAAAALIICLGMASLTRAPAGPPVSIAPVEAPAAQLEVSPVPVPVEAAEIPAPAPVEGPTEPSSPPHGAPRASAPSPRAQMASIEVSGVDNAILVGANDARIDAGQPVPPGTWRLWIPSANGEYVQVMRRTFRAGERVRVVCEPRLSVCRER